MAKQTHQKHLVVALCVAFFCVLILGGCAAPVSKATIIKKPARAAHSSLSCTQAASLGSVLLFEGAATRCIQEAPRTPSDQDESQKLTPMAVGVTQMCAFRQNAWISYESYADPGLPQQSEAATGMVSIWVQGGTCLTAQSAIHFAAVSVTSIWFNPFLGGSTGPDEPNLLHQVTGNQCSKRQDFFEVWYAGGQQKACYANEGFTTLANPLTNVVKVCSGANEGELDGGSSEPLTGFSVSVDAMDTCVNPGDYLGLGEQLTPLTITGLGIYALS